MDNGNGNQQHNYTKIIGYGENFNWKNLNWNNFGTRPEENKQFKHKVKEKQ